MQILQPHSLYQMVLQQFRDTTRKPFGRNNIYNDRQSRLKGSSSNIPVNCPNGIKLYNNKMGGIDLTDKPNSAYQLDRSFDFISVCFLICLMLVLSILSLCLRNWKIKI